MAISTLDPVTALILVDLQKGIVALPVAHPAADIVARCRRLADAFRSRGLPVVLVNVAGAAPGRTEVVRNAAANPPDWAELVADLGCQAGDQRFTKRTWGAFTGTGLDAFLRGRGVSQVVIAGIATSIGVESTARQAQELGYHVNLAVDAMTDLNADAHHNSIARIFPRLGETGTVGEIIALLDNRSA